MGHGMPPAPPSAPSGRMPSGVAAWGGDGVVSQGRSDPEDAAWFRQLGGFGAADVERLREAELLPAAKPVPRQAVEKEGGPPPKSVRVLPSRLMPRHIGGAAVTEPLRDVGPSALARGWFGLVMPECGPGGSPVGHSERQLRGNN